jgi:hypothetical protein
MAVIEFMNIETKQALEPLTAYYHLIAPKIPVSKLPTLPAKIAYQKFLNGKAVFTVITRE